MFSSDRIHFERNEVTGMMRWWCDTREGILGPFDTKENARASLQIHIKYCQEHGLDGDRTLGLSGNI